MLNATTRLFGMARHALRKGGCVLLLSMFSFAAVASTCCEIDASAPAHATHYSDSVAIEGGGHHKHEPDACIHTVEACVTSGGEMATILAARIPPPAAAPQPRNLPEGWPPLRLTLIATIPPSPPLPLYLQTSRLLI
jgi:hypothetical protein